MKQLRDYQEDCLRAVREAWRNGIDRQLVVLPTGAGKTVVMSHIIKGRHGRAMFIAHRNELIEQTYRCMTQVIEDGRTILTCKMQDWKSADIIIATVQSINKETLKSISRYGDLQTLIVDEAHHSTARSYRTILEHFNPSMVDPDPKPSSHLLIVGCTATPTRTNGVPLKGIYREMVYSLPIVNLIRSKHLARVEARSVIVPTREDLVVRTRAGDYVQGDILQLNTPLRNQIIVDSYKKHAITPSGGYLKAIAFCMSIDHSEQLAKLMNEQGVRAQYVHGKMSKNDIKQIFSEFRKGGFDVLTSRDLIIEGFDDPSVCCVLMCRPTKSGLVYKQCLGRGLRYHPDKEFCLVLDFCDIGHSLRGSYHMGCIEYYAMVILTMFAFAAKCMRKAILAAFSKDTEEELMKYVSDLANQRKKRPKPITKHIGDRVVDIIYSSKYVWVPVGSGNLEEIITISSDKEAYLQAVLIGQTYYDRCPVPYRHYTIKLIYLDEVETRYGNIKTYRVAMYDDRIVYRSHPKFATFSNFYEAMDHAEARADSFLKNQYFERHMMELSRPITDKQFESFKDYYPITPETTMGELNMLNISYSANKLYKAISVPASEETIKHMRRLSIDIDDSVYLQHNASAMIDATLNYYNVRKAQRMSR